MYCSNSTLLLLALSAATSIAAAPYNSTNNAAQTTPASTAAPDPSVTAAYQINAATIDETSSVPSADNGFCDVHQVFTIVAQGVNQGTLPVQCEADNYYNTTSQPDASQPVPFNCTDSDVQAQWYPTTPQQSLGATVTISLANQDLRVWRLEDITKPIDVSGWATYESPQGITYSLNNVPLPL